MGLHSGEKYIFRILKSGQDALPSTHSPDKRQRFPAGYKVKELGRPGTVVHSFNSGTQEVEAGRSRSAWS